MSKCNECYSDNNRDPAWAGWLWQCPNMKMKKDDTSMTHEHYECKECGERTKLDYEEMR